MTARTACRIHRLGIAAIAFAIALSIPAVCGVKGGKVTGAPSDDQGGAQVTVRPSEIHVAPLKMDVNLVVVNVTVTDPFDRIVTGMEKENFQIYDEKVEQNIVAFSTEDAPISVGMIFDSSGSMGNKIQKSKDAALQFFKTSNPQDEFMLVSFADQPNLISGFTAKLLENLQERLLTVKSSGRTALLDAVYVGLNEMKKATTNRRALLIISDGGDNHSRYTDGDIKRAVKEADVQIYAVGIFESPANMPTSEESRGPSLLAELAEISGGRMFSVENTDELPDIAEKISIELRNQYVIGYKPSNLIRDGRWRRIRVKLNPPKGLPPLQVYSRTGYYAPTQ